MKTILLILMSVLIIVVFAKLPANAVMSINVLHECQDKVGKLQDKIMDLKGDITDFAKNNNTNSSFDDTTRALDVASDLDVYLAKLAHLSSLLRIIEIITNSDERDQVIQIMNVHIKYVSKVEPAITFINELSSHTKSPALVSLCNQAKVELRNGQELLKYIGLNINQ